MLIAETTIVVSADCIFILLKNYHANCCDIVLNVPVEIYHTQQQIRSLLLSIEIQDFTQELTQGANK